MFYHLTYILPGIYTIPLGLLFIPQNILFQFQCRSTHQKSTHPCRKLSFIFFPFTFKEYLHYYYYIRIFSKITAHYLGETTWKSLSSAKKDYHVSLLSTTLRNMIPRYDLIVTRRQGSCSVFQTRGKYSSGLFLPLV